MHWRHLRICCSRSLCQYPPNMIKAFLGKGNLFIFDISYLVKVCSISFIYLICKYLADIFFSCVWYLSIFPGIWFKMITETLNLWIFMSKDDPQIIRLMNIHVRRCVCSVYLTVITLLRHKTKLINYEDINL